MLNTNPPVHTRLRALASRAFTPRAANATRERIRALTVEHLLEFVNIAAVDDEIQREADAITLEPL